MKEQFLNKHGLCNFWKIIQNKYAAKSHSHTSTKKVITGTLSSDGYTLNLTEETITVQ